MDKWREELLTESARVVKREREREKGEERDRGRE